jgi:16S rRNA (cytosine967-C5)-methyltransferase
MSYLIKHAQIAANLLIDFDFKTPFNLYLNKYFSLNKKMGSKDRKNIREACYLYFRFGNMMPQLSPEEKIILGFMQNQKLEVDVQLFKKAGYVLQKDEWKIDENELLNLFPCKENVSETVFSKEFLQSHLEQGKVFFRKTKIGSAIHVPESIEISPNIYCAPNQIRLNDFVDAGHIQIQDLSSQRVCQQIIPGKQSWDVCAGSGGKTLHLCESHPKSSFHVSDKRPQILENLKQRFKLCKIQQPNSGSIDMQKATSILGFDSNKINSPYFDSIILDVPCTGSGTWRRNPENLLGFNCKSIEEYAEKQKLIVENSIYFLKKGCLAYYITCSVFTQENEGHFQKWNDLNLEIVSSNYYNGLKEGGDILYMAVLKKI